MKKRWSWDAELTDAFISSIAEVASTWYLDTRYVEQGYLGGPALPDETGGVTSSVPVDSPTWKEGGANVRYRSSALRKP